MKNTLVLGLIVQAFVACCAWADDTDSGIHLPAGKTTSMMWTVNDGSESRWDINTGGNVEGGSNGAYSGGMYMQMTDGSGFGPNSSNATISADGREIELGPWQYNNMRVFRRIYVDAKKGYCRWIDIFENTSTQDQAVGLRYRTRMGSSISEIVSNSGRADVGAKDWAFVNGYRDDSSRPCVAHFFASRGCKVKPTVEFVKGNSELYYNMNLPVPAGQTVALCFFESQQASIAKAKDFMKDFDPRKELESLPPALKRIIVNMALPAFSLEGIDLPRDDKADLAVMRKGGEVRGTIGNEKFVIQTPIGKQELPAANVMGMSVPSESGPTVQLVLVDGQILCGRLEGPVKMKLDNGQEVSLAPKDVKTISYRISPARPAEILSTSAFVVLRNGQRLFIKPSDAEVTFQSLHGKVKVQADQASIIHFDTPDGGLHRLVFRDTSVLSGLVDSQKLTLNLALGGTLEVRTDAISRIQFGGEPVEPESATHVVLHNDDELVGQFNEKGIEIQTDSGKISCISAEIATMDFLDTGVGSVQVKMVNANTYIGKLTAKSLKFELENGPELSIFVGHMANIKFSRPSLTGTTPAKAVDTNGPATPGTPLPPGTAEMRPATPSEAVAEPANKEEALRVMKARAAAQAQADAEAAKLKALGKNDEAAKVILDADKAKQEADELAKTEAALEAQLAATNKLKDSPEKAQLKKKLEAQLKAIKEAKAAVLKKTGT